MKNEFDNVIHVFHQGDPDAALTSLLDTRPAYIGISPSNDVMTPQRMVWLDEVYKKVPKEVKTHGFAVTSFTLMQSFHWFSVDSTSWFMIGMYGKLCVPLDNFGHVVCGDGVICEKKEISISPRKLHSSDGYKTLQKTQSGFIEQVDKYIEYLCKKFPVTPQKLFDERNEARVMCNLSMFLQFEKQPRTCQVEVNSLF